MVNVGIIGCGHIAWQWDDPKDKNFNTHAKAYYCHPDVVLKACCDKSFKKAKDLAIAYPGVVPYVSYEDMLLKEKLDIVSVCTTTEAHFEVLDFILRCTNIKYILAEKPLTASLRETQKIYVLAKDRKAHIIVNYLRRYDKTSCELVDIIRKRILGKCELGIVFTYGDLRRNAVHFLDFFDFIGAPLTLDCAVTGSLLLFRTKDESPVYLHLVSEKKYPCNEMDLFFEKGRVSIEENSDVEIFRSRDSRVFDGFRQLVSDRYMSHTIHLAMKRVINDIVRKCQAHEMDFVSLENELYLARLMESAADHLRKARGKP